MNHLRCSEDRIRRPCKPRHYQYSGRITTSKCPHDLSRFSRTSMIATTVNPDILLSVIVSFVFGMIVGNFLPTILPGLTTSKPNTITTPTPKRAYVCSAYESENIDGENIDDTYVTLEVDRFVKFCIAEALDMPWDGRNGFFIPTSSQRVEAEYCLGSILVSMGIFNLTTDQRERWLNYGLELPALLRLSREQLWQLTTAFRCDCSVDDV